jgi:hypothetical protein
MVLSPDSSVWGLPASVAESVTVRHVRGYRGFVRFPLWHSLEISDCWGPLCSRVVDARVWVWQISDVTLHVTYVMVNRLSAGSHAGPMLGIRGEGLGFPAC